MNFDGKSMYGRSTLLSINKHRCTPMFCHWKYMNIVVLSFKIIENHWKALHNCALSSKIAANDVLLFKTDGNR